MKFSGRVLDPVIWVQLIYTSAYSQTVNCTLYLCSAVNEYSCAQKECTQWYLWLSSKADVIKVINKIGFTCQFSLPVN